MEEKKSLKQIIKENWKLWLAIAGGAGTTVLASILFYNVGWDHGYFTREGEIENLLNSSMANSPLNSKA